MHCIILGAGGSVNTVKRHNTALYFKIGSSGLMVDCNGVVVQRLKAAGIAFEDLQHIFLTHEHIDHLGYINNFLHQLWVASCLYRPVANRRVNPIYIYGNARVIQVVDSLLKATSMREHPMMFPVHLVKLETEGSIQIDGREVEYFPVNHGPTPCFGLEVREVGKGAFVYSGDTEPTVSVYGRLRPEDTLIHECNKIDCEINREHTTWSQLKNEIKNIKSKRIVLVHLPPMDDHAEAEFTDRLRQEYGDRIVVALDGMSLGLD